MNILYRCHEDVVEVSRESQNGSWRCHGDAMEV